MVLTLILSSVTSYGQQNDTLTYFTPIEMRQIGRYIEMFNKDRVELCEEWNKDLVAERSLLKLDLISSKDEIRQLTENINATKRKLQKARRAKIAWGAIGVGAGFLIYGIVN